MVNPVSDTPQPSSGSPLSQEIKRLFLLFILDDTVYQKIARDHRATLSAGIVVVCAGIIAGLAHGFVNQIRFGSTTTEDMVTTQPLIAIVIAIVLLAGFWLIMSWLYVQVASALFAADSPSRDLTRMLRVIGYSCLFNLLNVIPLFGVLLSVSMQIIGHVIGIREATGLSALKSFLTMAAIYGTILLLWLGWFVISLTLQGTPDEQGMVLWGSCVRAHG
ncbi:MAG: hypothetical protein HC837_19250 [Chloroflexaceae bacterium]|nr:hypothetical protein [Chloroflexaceae bacterium]